MAGGAPPERRALPREDAQMAEAERAGAGYSEIPVRDTLDALGDRFGSIGYGIVALFLVCWIASILFHRWQRAADAPAR